MPSKEASNRYHRKNTKNMGSVYVQPVTCPKCGKHGYVYIHQNFNTKLKHALKPYFEVLHFRRVDGKKLYGNTCYLGMMN